MYLNSSYIDILTVSALGNKRYFNLTGLSTEEVDKKGEGDFREYGQVFYLERRKETNGFVGRQVAIFCESVIIWPEDIVWTQKLMARVVLSAFFIFCLGFSFVSSLSGALLTSFFLQGRGKGEMSLWIGLHGHKCLLMTHFATAAISRWYLRDFFFSARAKTWDLRGKIK